MLTFLLNVCFPTLQPTIGLAGVQNNDSEPPRRAVNITVDSRIELLAVVQLLSGYDKRYGLITRFDFPYKQDVREHFSSYKNHPAVKLFDRMSADGFSFDAPPAAMLYLSKPPELTLELPFTKYLNGRAGGAERLKKLVELLRDFARETEFMAFFDTHRGAFQQMMANAQRKMGGINYAQTLQNYYGMSQNSYNILLAPLFTGGFGPRIERSEGKYDIYNILGPMNMENGLPAFGSEESFRHIAWPNPRNPEKGMVFYTAQRPQDVLNINSVFHGPTDYVIARATECLVSANYDKQNGMWSLTTGIGIGTETKKTRKSKPNERNKK